jgi:hypothetical protein
MILIGRRPGRSGRSLDGFVGRRPAGAVARGVEAVRVVAVHVIVVYLVAVHVVGPGHGREGGRQRRAARGVDDVLRRGRRRPDDRLDELGARRGPVRRPRALLERALRAHEAHHVAHAQPVELQLRLAELAALLQVQPEALARVHA